MGSLLAHHGLFTSQFKPHVILLKRDSESAAAAASEWLVGWMPRIVPNGILSPKSYLPGEATMC